MFEKDKGSFLLYTDNRNILEMLSVEERGIWITNIYRYLAGEDLLTMNDKTSMLFAVSKNHLDRDYKKWLDRCEQNAINGKKGGDAKAQNQATATNRYQPLPTATNRYQNLANLADNENDNENVIDIEKENEGERDNGNGKSNPYDEIIFYGENHNIPLTKTQYIDLCTKCSRELTDDFINKMSLYRSSRGLEIDDKYNYYSQLKKWINEDYRPEDIEGYKDHEKGELINYIAETKRINELKKGTKNYV